MVNELMKSSNPKKDILLVNNILSDTKFKDSHKYSKEEIQMIKDRFLDLFSQQKFEYESIKTYFDKMNYDDTVVVRKPEVSIQQLKYQEYYERGMIRKINHNKIKAYKPLPSKLKHMYDMNHLLCIVLYSNLNNPRETMLYQQLDKIK
jgi:hypothetical protein